MSPLPVNYANLIYKLKVMPTYNTSKHKRKNKKMSHNTFVYPDFLDDLVSDNID